MVAFVGFERSTWTTSLSSSNESAKTATGMFAVVAPAAIVIVPVPAV